MTAITCAVGVPRVNILGVQFHNITCAEAVERMEQMTAERSPGTVKHFV